MKQALTLLLLCAVQLKALAQEKLSTITAPTSPASYVLGLQPSAVLSPKSYQALEAALYSNFANNNSFSIPNDFGLEFTPYWAKDHSLSIQDYLFPRLGTQVLRNASFSLASTQKFLLGNAAETNALGIGFRTNLFLGGGLDKKRVTDFVDRVRKNQQTMSKIGSEAEKVATVAVSNDNFLLLIRPVIEQRVANVFGGTNAKDLTDGMIRAAKAGIKNDITKEPDQYLDNLYNVLDSVLAAGATFEEFKSYIKNRVGFSLDLAYAGMVNFPDNNFEYSHAPRHAAWITPSYFFKLNEDHFLKLAAVARYEWLDKDYYGKFFPGVKSYQNNWNYGLAVEGKFQKFSLQLEAVGRRSRTEIPAGTDPVGNPLYRKETDNDFQYVGTFSFRINDGLSLNYSLGNRFEPLTNPISTLISLLSINLGIGGPTTGNLK